MVDTKPSTANGTSGATSSFSTRTAMVDGFSIRVPARETS
jgi:hypothetical protein